MKKKNGLKWQIPFLLLLVVGTVWILRKQAPYQTDQGLVFGTMYKITYQSKENLKAEIEAELQRVDRSLSPFNKASVITRINDNTDMQTDSLFDYVYRLARQVSEETHGAFDITVAPLVNAWGFGFKNASQVDSATIDSLCQFVGYDKVKLENGRIVKSDPRTMLDCSAIAIGGELVMKGENAQMKPWRIGINKPIDDSLAVNQELQTVLQVSGVGLATSGNYRNFYYKDGKKYAHTIDPRTGYPIQHNILSATVIADNCAKADAYATAFMVLGLDSAKAVCRAHPELDAYFIYSKDDGKTDIYYTEGMEKYIAR